MAKDTENKTPAPAPTPDEKTPAPAPTPDEKPPVGYSCLQAFSAWGNTYNKGDPVDIRAWIGDSPKTTADEARNALKNRIASGYVELSVNT